MSGKTLIRIKACDIHRTSCCNDMFWSISVYPVEAGSTDQKSVFACVGLPRRSLVRRLACGY